MNEKVFMVFNRNCLPKMTDFSSLAPPPQVVTYTVKSGSIKQMVRDRRVVTTHTNRNYHMAYQFVPFPMTLHDFEGHLSNT